MNLGKKSKPNDFFTRMLYWVPRYTKKNFTAVGPWGDPLYAFDFWYLESRVERINNSDKFASDCSFELNNHIPMTAIMTLCGANQVFRVVRPLLFEIFAKNRSQHKASLSISMKNVMVY